MSSPSKRRRPNNLNLDSTEQPASILKSRDQPPLTPPPKSKARVARSRANPPVSRGNRADDYFVEPSTPHPFDANPDADHASMSNKENAFVRDSHDLSLSTSQPTRDSLMANMLLSLDQLTLLGQATPAQTTLSDEPRGYSTNYAPAPTIADERTWTGSSRAPRPNLNSNYVYSHSYSYSSDLEVGDDAARINRGRRSHSSSYYQTGPGRLNSMRESVRSSQPSTPRRLHNRGTKGSKSSSTNSADQGYAQVHGNQRWAHGFARKSSSFDYGTQRSNTMQQAWQANFPESFLNNDYDAAPTPTIPGGPRRTAPPTPVPTAYDYPEPLPEPIVPTLERKRSTRSAKSHTSSGRKGETKYTLNEVIPPVPTFNELDLDSAPAPSVGYEKAKDAPPPAASPAAPASYATPQPKEKQGFFRRVFGSRSTSAAQQAVETTNSPGQFSSHSTESSDRPRSKPQQTKTQSTPPSREAHQPGVLHKKPSSFFRRRKKSTADPDTPPVPSHHDAPPLPTHPLVPTMDLDFKKDAPFVAPTEASPASSLRKVMSPYLKGNPAPANKFSVQSPLADTPSTTADEAEGYQREFSPGYEPSPKAVIRTVNDSSSPHTKASRDTPDSPSETRNNSFLNLDPPSDAEYDALTPSKESTSAAAGRTKGGLTSAADKEARQTPPASVAQPTVDSDNADSRVAAHDGRDTRYDTLRPTRRRNRPALDITDSEEDSHSPVLGLPIEGARSTSGSFRSPMSESKSADGEAPGAEADGLSAPPPQIVTTSEHMDTTPIDEPNFVVGDPTEDDRQKAQKIFDGNEDFIQKDKATGWMGGEGPVRQRTLRAYMELYDFRNLSILASLREVCGRLVLRGETQQVDRILLAFSTRWAESNPSHGFKSVDTIHMICYSIMLLNTDLHLADIEHKMTRGQFVKNTLTTIVHAIEEDTPAEFNRRGSILPGKGSTLATDEVRPSVDQSRPSNRFSFIPPGRTDTSASDAPVDDCGPLVKSPFDGNIKAWEGQVETVLKDIYASIRDERLPLFGAEPERYQSGPASQSNLSVMGMLKRTPSVLSKTPSENQSIRGRVAENSRANASRWASKSRSRHRLGGTGFSSSRTSFDDGNSMWSPAGSSANWSRQSLGRTHTTMSMDSFGSSWPRDEYQQSIGFANALSQAIIREDVPTGKAQSIMSDDGFVSPQLLEDESLELAGPPWVKEGMVTHKHHLDGIERKAKDRNWSQVFAVIQKGTLSLFSFTPNKSLRSKRAQRLKGAQAGPIQVGGGNWQENATNLGSFNLRQALASALPPPGYSRSRPHVWALSLPTGAVHLFQVGTPEIIKEFVTTANYWSARLSTHPLVGGISNIEYGWGESIVNNALVAAANTNESGAAGPNPPPTAGTGRMSRPGSSAANGPARRGSMQSGRSFRSGSFDYGAGRPGSGGRQKLPGDVIHIAEWAAPAQSMRPSTVGEEEQLHVLEAYVRSIEEELQGHNQLRGPMLLAFTPRGQNAGKAMANWERKSAYLLREIVKFRTYVDCLQQADARKKEIYQEREERERELELEMKE